MGNRFFILIFFLLITFSGCNNKEDKEKAVTLNNSVEPQQILTVDDVTEKRPNIFTEKNQVKILSGISDQDLKQSLITKYQVPKEWGENVTGVKTRLDTSDKVIALTLDACGGVNGSKYDAELIYYLRQQNIPATLFINSRWIDSNYWTFVALSKLPLFEIENHGTAHRPLSINGNEAWGIKGTSNVSEMVDEVLSNHRKIQKLTGREPKFFRAGTAFYDEIGVQVTNELGEQVVNFNVLGDAGATFNKEQVRDALLNAQPGSIVLLHMNQPDSETFEGIKMAIPELKRRGISFVKLEDMQLR